MNRKNIIEEVAKTLQTKQDADAAVRVVFDSIKNALNNNEKVLITGFGIFIPKMTAARTTKHPRTQKPMVTSPKRTVRFKPSENLLK